MTKGKIKQSYHNRPVNMEKINTLIERSVALTVFFMAAGLFYCDAEGYRGLPFTWLYSGNSPDMQSRTWAFLTSLLCAFAIVIICELVAAAIRKASEPVGFVSNSSLVKQNVFPDLDDYEPNYSYSQATQSRVSAQSAKKQLASAQKSLQKTLQKPAHSGKTLPKPNIAKRQRSGDFISPVMSKEQQERNAATAIVFTSVVIIFIVIGFLAISSLEDDSYDLDPIVAEDETVYDEYGEDTYNTDFYLMDGFLSSKCDDIFAVMSYEDEDDVAILLEEGYGDEPDPNGVSDLLEMFDWADVDYTEVCRSIELGDPDEAFIRYEVTSGDDTYIVAFKFAGDGMANDEELATLVGIAACPYESWNELHAQQEDTVDMMAYVGDISYQDDDILTW